MKNKLPSNKNQSKPDSLTFSKIDSFADDQEGEALTSYSRLSEFMDERSMEIVPSSPLIKLPTLPNRPPPPVTKELTKNSDMNYFKNKVIRIFLTKKLKKRPPIDQLKANGILKGAHLNQIVS